MFRPNVTLEDIPTSVVGKATGKAPRMGMFPIPHKEWAVTTLAVCQAKGMQVSDPIFCVSKDLLSFGLAWGLTFPTPAKVPRGMTPVMGLSTSNTGHRQTQMFCGLGPVGNTEAAVPLIRVRRPTKKARDFRIHEYLDKTLEAFKTRTYQAPFLLRELERRKLADPVAMRLLYEAARQQMLPGSRVFLVDRLFFRQKYSWKRTSRLLYECFCGVSRMNPPDKQMVQQMKFLSIVPRTVLVFQY